MKYFTFFLCLIFISCSDNTDEQLTTPLDSEFGWVISQSDLRGSYTPFPLATNLNFKPIVEVDFLKDTQKVAVVKIDGIVKIYPSNFVNIFEVVNDQIANFKYAITYCPITESVVGFNRIHQEKEFNLIASGYLYKNNQVLFDKNTDTYWSQMELKCIRGQFQFENLETFPLIETSWKTAQSNFPNASVFVNGTKTIVKKASSKHSFKNRNNETSYYGVVNFNAKDNSLNLYGFDLFENEISIHKKSFDDLELVVVGSKNLQFINSFINYDNIEFTPLQDDFPNIMTDTEGNTWNVFGVVTAGPKKGEQLSSPTGFFASLWAWESFYDSIIINKND